MVQVRTLSDRLADDLLYGDESITVFNSRMAILYIGTSYNMPMSLMEMDTQSSGEKKSGGFWYIVV